MPKQKKSGFDEVFDFFFNLFVVTPWWIGPIVAGLTYLFLGQVLPAIIQGQQSSTDSATVVHLQKTVSQVLVPVSIRVAPWGAGVVLFIWLLSLLQKMNRRALFNKTRGVNEVRKLSWQKFEMLVAEYYRRRGFSVEERGGAKADGGIDIVLLSGNETILVQCKHWKVYKVGVQPVRELLGVMSHRKAARGILVTSGVFTQEALSFARGNRIELIDGEKLAKLIQSVQQCEPVGAPDTAQAPPERILQSTTENPTCPKCGSSMVLRTARNGPNMGSRFFGCEQYPRCRGTRAFHA